MGFLQRIENRKKECYHVHSGTLKTANEDNERVITPSTLLPPMTLSSKNETSYFLDLDYQERWALIKDDIEIAHAYSHEKGENFEGDQYGYSKRYLLNDSRAFIEEIRASANHKALIRSQSDAVLMFSEEKISTTTSIQQGRLYLPRATKGNLLRNEALDCFSTEIKQKFLQVLSTNNNFLCHLEGVMFALPKEYFRFIKGK